MCWVLLLWFYSYRAKGFACVGVDGFASKVFVVLYKFIKLAVAPVLGFCYFGSIVIGLKGSPVSG